MEQRISLVTLGVTDLAAARRFYEGLGWKPGFLADDVAFYQLNGAVLALWSRAALAADMRRQDGPTFEALALAHNVRDRAAVDAALREAEAAGARILKPAEEQPWGGYSGYFADRDGHAWEVAWNPGWTLGEDGSVRLQG
jgi:catechol 2,3-dioxygenase-like lactoylglutathione lyase family enzyme